MQTLEQKELSSISERPFNIVNSLLASSFPPQGFCFLTEKEGNRKVHWQPRDDGVRTGAEEHTEEFTARFQGKGGKGMAPLSLFLK